MSKGKMIEINFSDDLKKIAPERLIDIENSDKIENFFLVLGLIYNDIKDLLYFRLNIEDELKITPKIISPRIGEYSGMKIHVEKLLISTIHSFFKFLESHNDVLKTATFRQAYDSLNQNQKDRWDNLVEISHLTQKESKDSFANILWGIRNKGSFHYEDSEDALRNSFIQYFLKDEKNEGNKYAYYLIGDSMEQSRFYFSDGAMEVANRMQISERSDTKEFYDQLSSVLNDLNHAILFLMKHYLKQRPHVGREK